MSGDVDPEVSVEVSFRTAGGQVFQACEAIPQYSLAAMVAALDRAIHECGLQQDGRGQ